MENVHCKSQRFFKQKKKELILFYFIKDLISFIFYKKIEKKFTIGFFCENEFIFSYLEPYIQNKVKKKKIVIISFEKINLNNIDNIEIFVFKTNFFRELLFLTLKLKFLYSSTPDLNNTLFKRSKFSNCKYIYLQHSPVSLNLIYRENAFDFFDAIQVISKYQFNEIEEIKKINSLNVKVFKSKYLFVEKQKKNKVQNNKIDVLIAPSWNTQFYKLNCHQILKKLFFDKNISFRLRPHPMSYLKNEISLNQIRESGIILDESKHINFLKYENLISDWSGIFIEYSLITKRKAYLINTPKKLTNKKYEKYKNKPIEILFRDKMAQTYEVNDIPKLIDKILNKKIKIDENLENDELKKIIEENFY